MTFGEHLAELLHERGLSRSWLATHLQVDASVVDAWCSDAQPPGSRTIERLAYAMKVPMEVLMSLGEPGRPHCDYVHHRRRTFYRTQRFWRRSTKL